MVKDILSLAMGLRSEHEVEACCWAILLMVMSLMISSLISKFFLKRRLGVSGNRQLINEKGTYYGSIVLVLVLVLVQKVL